MSLPYRLHLALLLAGLAASRACAQSVGIGTPSAGAALEIASPANNSGLLIPRLTAAQRAAITAPPQGLLVYQTDGTAAGGPQTGFWYFAGSPAAWTFLSPTGVGDNLGNHTATQPLSLQANALTGTGASVGTAVGLGVRTDGGLNLGQNTAGTNVFLGYQAGELTTTGDRNQFVGYQSGKANTSGNINYFSGYQSGLANTTGFANYFSGPSSGLANTTGRDNHFVGVLSGFRNTTGNENQFEGFRSGESNTIGTRNQFSGFDSGGLNSTGSNNLYIGYQSGFFSTTASNNQLVGFNSGFNNTTGHENQFSGNGSGLANTTGFNNQFDGYQSGQNTTTGFNNLFVGWASGLQNTTGAGNTAFGFEAGPTTANLTNAAAFGNSAQVSQSNCLVLGGTGASAVNVGIGTTAPAAPLDVQSTGSLGSYSFAFYARGGNGAAFTGNGTFAPTNVSLRTSGRVVAAEFDAVSDARLKTVCGPSDNAADLALLTQLRVTDYTMRDRAQFGARLFKKVIAQEVERVFPQAVTTQKGFLPDVYAPADAARAEGDSLLVLALPAGPAVLAQGATAGQRLRLIGPAGEITAVVARPAAPGSRRLVVRGAQSLAGRPVFVFGLEHADVRAVDYEALAMLNISATQELARRLQAAATRAEAAAAGLEKRLRTLEARSGGFAHPVASAPPTLPRKLLRPATHPKSLRSRPPSVAGHWKALRKPPPLLAGNSQWLR